MMQKKLGLGLLLALTSSALFGWFSEREYDREGGPLEPCAFSLQVQGGVNPIVWTGRSSDCLAGVELPSFLHLFKVPWIVGGQVGYNWADWVYVYGEVDYTRARGKDCLSFPVTCTSSVNGNATIFEKLGTYSAVAAYGGSRFYFNSCWSSCWMDRASFFVGTKVGFVHHYEINVAISATSTSGDFGPYEAPMFFRNNTVSAGFNLGIQWDVWCNFSVLLTGEVVANGCLRENSVICLCEPIPGIRSNTALVGRFCTELWFPITLGLKYTF